MAQIKFIIFFIFKWHCKQGNITWIEENGDSAEIQVVSGPMCNRGSPTTSPVIHLRRRKTLRMLLSRGGSGH
nr:uncharacterized protein LOC109177626 isoform X3 [Ipomoea batatas]GME15532.1 uncharacterized protein LOC109177626 isoform X3 [Ipomoea batatas]GME19256.1 uncharacterized protein LOC109177626 isoform X3 [Ipomoea batatas]